MDGTVGNLLEALARHRRGDLAGAGALCRSVLAGPAPPDAEHGLALHLLGVIASAQGAHAEAVARLDMAAVLRPDNAETRLALGNALVASGDPVGGAAAYRLVLLAQPTHLAALLNLANVHLQLGRADLAAASLQLAATAHPAASSAHAGLASALLRLDEPARALAAANAALALAPDLASAWFAAGTALSALGRAEEAAGALRRATGLAPGDALARLNLGNARLDLDHVDAAEADIRAALALDPTLAEAHASLGFLLTGAGRLDDAIAACDEAIRLRPGFARAHWNRSFAHLLAGDYARGWADYEWRRRDPAFAADFPPLAGPEWQGETLAGRHLLVHARQGLGDTIQLCRYLPLLAGRGARVTLACARPLHRLLRELPVAIVDRAGAMPAHDLWVDQMSLPRLFATTPETIPAAAGYLRRVATRPHGPVLRVGLVGSGNPSHSNDRRRSIPTATLAPLADVPGIAWTSLQVGPRAAEQAAMLGVAHGSAQPGDFADTAERISQLDLVIAVDTSTAHLAGAMGVPVWILLPAAADWRWIAGRRDSPWYASARLFRQGVAGDWTGVVTQVATALAALRGW